MVEYGLIVGFLAMITLSVMVLVGPEMSEMVSASVDDDMLDRGQAGISSMIYVEAPAAAAAAANWGTHTPSLSQTSVSLWNQPVGTTRDIRDCKEIT